MSYTVVDYRLTPGSAAIDTGAGEGAPPADIRGNPRPFDVPDAGVEGEDAFDIGAYEWDVLHVVSVTREGPTLTNAVPVYFLVKFSAPVQSIDSTDLPLVVVSGDLGDPAGLYVSNIENVDDGGLLWRVEVSVGPGEDVGELRLDVLDDDSIIDYEGRLLGGEGPDNGNFSDGEIVTIDREPPSVLELEGVPNPAKLGTVVDISFLLSEPVTECEVTVNGNPATPTIVKDSEFHYTYTILETDPDGCATVIVNATDCVGNTGGVEVCEADVLWVDKTLPEFTNFTSDHPVANFGTVVRGNPVVDVMGFPASYVSNAGLDYVYTYTVGGASLEMLQVAVITGSDYAGNEGSSQFDAFVVDNTPPEFTDLTATPLILKSGRAVTLWFLASETLVGPPEVSLLGGDATFVSYAGSYSYSFEIPPLAPDGLVSVFVEGMDLAGNYGEQEFADVFTVDNTPPEFDITATPTYAKSGTTVALSVTASEPLFEDQTPVVQINGLFANWVGQAGLTYTYEYGVTPGDTEGWATVTASSSDVAENEGSDTRTDLLFIDLTPPTFSNIAVDPALAKEGGTVAITFTASEDLIANPAVTVNGNAAAYSANTDLDYSYTYTVLPADPDGAAAMVVTGADLAGNIGTGDSNALIIDKTPPVFDPIAATPSLAKLGTEVTITFTSSDVLGGPPVVTVNGNPATPPAPGKAVPYAFTYTVQESDPDGLATIVITGSDPAGNETTTTADNILTIDKTPPAFTEIAANPASIQQATSTTITFKSSEELVADPVVTVNGNASVFVLVEALDYTFSYTALAAEPFGPAVIAIQGEDLAGNVGTATDEEALTIVPPAPPTVEIGPPSVLATNTGPVSFTVTYSANAAEITLAEGDVLLELEGTTGSVAVTGASGFERTVTLSNISGNGTIGISIAAGTATDAFDQAAVGAGPSDLVEVDNTAPVITILGDNPASIMVRDTYTDAGATASDTRDGDLTSAIQTDNTVDANTPGQYPVTYSVADSVGNTAEAVRTVNVEAYETCVQFLFPLDGSTIAVDTGETFWLAPVVEVDTAEAISSVEFFLDGTSIGEVTAEPYMVLYEMTSTAGSYELTARAYDAEDGIVCENFASFTVVVAEEGDDSDGNGLPDDPFGELPDTGDTWVGEDESEETGETITTVVSTLYNCDETPGPIALTLLGSEQVVTLTAPPALFTECEMAVIIFQMAPSIATLLGSAEAAVVQPEPEGNLAAGWNYYLCTILISEDGGGTFEEIDPARLAANPVNLVVAGAAVPGGAVFYTHDIYADSDALTGVKITGVPGVWDTSGVANVQLFGVAAQLDVVKPTLFAPYVLKAAGDETPPAWPWLLLLAALLGISLAGGGDDGGGGGPCFIATAAYGTPMASEVDALRELRDEYLLGSAVGTAFVDAYYRVSPAVAGVVGAHPALAWGIRLGLVPVILLSKALLVVPGAVVLAAVCVVWLAVRRRRKARRAA